MLENRDNCLHTVVASLAVLLLLGPTSLAQAERPPGKAFTLEDAVNFALQNYPAVRAAMEQVSATHAGVGLAKTRYLPRADMLWQSNRATRNNIFGLVLPQSVIPSISGPVLATSNNDSVWGSAGGLLVSWEPFDFGYRRATVDAARAREDRATAEVALTRLDVAAAAADAFVALLAARESVRAAQANVERRQVFAQAVHVLVDNQLRPGADASRADAEVAAANIQLIQAEQAQEVSRAALAQMLGIAGTEVEIEAGPLLGPPPASPPPAPVLVKHPLATAEKASLQEANARVRTEDRSFVPRFNFQSAAFGRGSGANPDGTAASGLNGLGLERANWAVGLTVTFPLFDLFSVRARKHIEASSERREEARYDQAIQDLTGQYQKARAAWNGARRVAENTPIQLQAARATESQARARYQAGLGTIVEIADAQRILVQAETDNALARLSVWRALFSIAAAQGDLQLFLQLLHGTGGP